MEIEIQNSQCVLESRISKPETSVFFSRLLLSVFRQEFSIRKARFKTGKLSRVLVHVAVSQNFTVIHRLVLNSLWRIYINSLLCQWIYGFIYCILWTKMPCFLMPRLKLVQTLDNLGFGTRFSNSSSVTRGTVIRHTSLFKLFKKIAVLSAGVVCSINRQPQTINYCYQGCTET